MNDFKNLLILNKTLYKKSPLLKNNKTRIVSDDQKTYQAHTNARFKEPPRHCRLTVIRHNDTNNNYAGVYVGGDIRLILARDM